MSPTRLAAISCALLLACAADKGSSPEGTGGTSSDAGDAASGTSGGGGAGTNAGGSGGVGGGAGSGQGGSAGTSGSGASAGDAGSSGAGAAAGAAGLGGTGATDASAGAGGGSGSGAGSGGAAGIAGSGGGDAGPPATITPGAPDRILLRGTVVAPTGPFDGEVLVEGTDITCAAASCSSRPGATGATTIDTNGVILPGLVDAHNHGLFNVFDENDWTPSRFYTHHDDWTVTANEPRYSQVVDAKQHLEASSGANLRCELAKYAEVKALIAGTTSLLMAPGAVEPPCMASVIRTIDTTHNDLPDDKIQTSISVPSSSSANAVCNNFFDGDTTAYVVHVGEGTDTRARNEFSSLIARGSTTGCNLPGGNCAGCLLSDKTVIVHGTALGTAEFTTMAQAGMKLVWSPRSNMFLYDDTTRIDLAIAAGVSVIALAPDWALGGSVNLLDELRFADQIDTQKFGDILSHERLFRMVTIDAARALAVDAYVGSIEAGKRADLTVVGAGGSSAYEALMAATPGTVRLVMVDGRVLYGDAALEAAGPATPGCEPLDVCGENKFLCLAEASTQDKLNQTFTEVVSALDAATLAYETTQGVTPFTPLAELTRCP